MCFFNRKRKTKQKQQNNIKCNFGAFMAITKRKGGFLQYSFDAGNCQMVSCFFGARTLQRPIMETRKKGKKWPFKRPPWPWKLCYSVKMEDSASGRFREPVISGEIMRLHHRKHHQAYVSIFNKALDQLDRAIKFDGGGTAISFEYLIIVRVIRLGWIL